MLLNECQMFLEILKIWEICEFIFYRVPFLECAEPAMGVMLDRDKVYVKSLKFLSE